MNGTIKRFLWVSAYAMAMAFLEAVVVGTERRSLRRPWLGGLLLLPTL